MSKYIIECVGTFFLTLAIVLTGNPIAIGLMLAMMVYVGGHVSGGHYNPAISLMMFMKNRLSMNDLLFYTIAQIIGAIGAGIIYFVITQSVFAPDTIPGISFVFTAGLEFLLTFVFCLVVTTVIDNQKYSSHGNDGMIIGLALMTVAFIGGLFNPAIGLSSVIVSLVKGGAFMKPENLIIFVVMPLLAAVVTPFVDKCCKGKM